MTNPYLWITVLGGIVSFLTGCGVGMNDLANAFGTTYGSRVLSLKQIVVLASVCEFAGAISLGAEVTSTISKGIAEPGVFAQEPYVLMYGMLCALGAAFTWLLLATLLSLPVSSTHSIAGGVVGFALVYGGVDAVYWAKKKKGFPFVSGVVPIIASWFVSPVLTGAVSALVYSLISLLVLRPANSVQRALYSIPIIVSLTFFLESFFVLFKGAKSRLRWSLGKAMWVSAIIGVGTGCLSVLTIPLLRRRVQQMTEQAELAKAEEEQAAAANPPFPDAKPDKELETAATGDVVANAKSSAESDRQAEAEEEDLPKFNVRMHDNRAEYVFRYLQVFTAICASFAHGANDVSNAVGPFAAIYNIYVNKRVSSKSEAPIWILALGGAGIVVGLATLGLRIMRLLGRRITTITPSRGFSAELAAALVVSFASGFGVPVSSTHCITGAVVAISIIDVGFCNVRWMIVAKLYAGWIVTLFITALISAAFFAQGIYAPSRTI